LTTTLEFRGSFSGREKNVFYSNLDGQEQFVEVAYLLGIDFDDDGRTVVPLDFDGDGDLDLTTGSLQNIKILQNKLAPKNFLRLRLESEKGVRQAIGAEVKVHAGGKVQWDYVKATAGFQAQPPLPLHFGLGDAKIVEKLEIKWPDGETTVLRDIGHNQQHLIGRKGIIKSHPLKKWPTDSGLSRKREFDLSIKAINFEDKAENIAQNGRITVVNFWAPWCKPCQSEIPYLLKLKALHPSVDFVGVSVETKKKGLVAEYVKKAKMSYAQRYATDELLESFFGDSGKLNLPSTFVFDQNGELRRAYDRPFELSELSSLLKAITERGVDTSLVLTTSNYLQARNRHKEAIETLSSALEKTPNSIEILLALSKSFAFTGKQTEAFDSLNKAVTIEPNNAFAWYARGVIAKSLRAGDTVPSFKRACSIDRGNKQYCTALGAAYFRAKQMKKAKAVFEQLVRQIPQDTETWINLAKARQLSNSGGAKQAIKRALEIDPNNKEARALIDKLSD